MANQVTPELVELVRQLEGFNPVAYHDGPQYSIGYGTRATAAEVESRQPISREAAEARLAAELQRAADYINNLDVRDVLTPSQFAALTSAAFNLGSFARNGGLETAIRSGTVADMASRLALYTGTQVPGTEAGVANRRDREVSILAGRETLPVPSGPPAGSFAGIAGIFDPSLGFFGKDGMFGTPLGPIGALPPEWSFGPGPFSSGAMDYNFGYQMPATVEDLAAALGMPSDTPELADGTQGTGPAGGGGLLSGFSLATLAPSAEVQENIERAIGYAANTLAVNEAISRGLELAASPAALAAALGTAGGWLANAAAGAGAWGSGLVPENAREILTERAMDPYAFWGPTQTVHAPGPSANQAVAGKNYSGDHLVQYVDGGNIISAFTRDGQTYTSREPIAWDQLADALPGDIFGDAPFGLASDEQAREIGLNSFLGQSYDIGAPISADLFGGFGPADAGERNGMPDPAGHGIAARGGGLGGQTAVQPASEYTGAFNPTGSQEFGLAPHASAAAVSPASAYGAPSPAAAFAPVSSFGGFSLETGPAPPSEVALARAGIIDPLALDPFAVGVPNLLAATAPTAMPLIGPVPSSHGPAIASSRSALAAPARAGTASRGSMNAAPPAALGGLAGAAGFAAPAIAPALAGWAASSGLGNLAFHGAASPGDPSGGPDFGYFTATDQNGVGVTGYANSAGEVFAFPSETLDANMSNVPYSDLMGAFSADHDTGGGAAGAKVLCGYYRRRGWLPRAVWLADERYAKRLPADMRRGYRAWARPLVRFLERGRAPARLLALLLWPLVRGFAQEMAFREGAVARGSRLGRLALATLGEPCRRLGAWLRRRETGAAIGNPPKPQPSV